MSEGAAKKGLTKREKLLILVAGTGAVLFLAVYFVIIPLYNSWSDKQEEYQLLLDEKAEMEIKLSLAPMTRSGYDSARSTLNETSKRYPFVMPNEDLYGQLTILYRNCRLASSGLSVAPNATPYSPDQQAASQSAVVYTQTATLTLAGTYDNLKTFIDRIEAMDQLRINRISFSIQEAMTELGSSRISVIVEMMMLNDDLRDMDK